MSDRIQAPRGTFDVLPDSAQARAHVEATSKRILERAGYARIETPTFESWDPEETVEGGERLSLAGFDIDVLFTPGHSPGHVCYSIADEQVLLDGDVLFRGSIGRFDLPGGNGEVLLESIAMLLNTLPDETRVLPGHMGATTLGDERASNPFLHQLAS